MIFFKREGEKVKRGVNVTLVRGRGLGVVFILATRRYVTRFRFRFFITPRFIFKRWHNRMTTIERGARYTWNV